MLYVKIIGGRHCVISDFIVLPHHLLKLFQRFGIQCSQNLQGHWMSACAIQWKTVRVLYTHTWRSDHRHNPLDNTMTIPPHTQHCKTYVLDCVFCWLLYLEDNNRNMVKQWKNFHHMLQTQTKWQSKPLGKGWKI
jgi:hypothetical protein